ncbi:MAG: hypothetical protein NUV94_07360 [Candidatus Acetothermia bacterium]|jgi:hypothetical protein|nr:hypothetical protein [Candidatus Acetothermia bacterium]
MDEAGVILRSTKGWLRARHALRGALAGATAGLAAAILGRAAGTSLPGYAWAGIPLLAVVGAGWPLSSPRLLLRVGRRLGLGERLAAVEVLAGRGATALLRPLVREIHALRPRPWRLLLGPAEAAGVAIAGALLLVLAYLPMGGPRSAVPSAPDELEVAAQAAPSEPARAEAAAPRAAEPPPSVAADAPLLEYSPYQDLLAAVLGLPEIPPGSPGPGDLAARLAQEEGLLRELADKVARSAPGGISASERQELVPLAQQVTRSDLREAVVRLLEQGDEESAREVEEALNAVLAAAERSGESGGGTEPPPEPSEETEAAVAAGAPTPGRAGERGEGASEPPEDKFGEDPADQEGDLAGKSPGGPLAGGEGDQAPPSSGAAVPLPVNPGEGPARAYVVTGVPGEPPASGEAGQPGLAPYEVDLVLRARDIPAELQDRVRRYFELITGGGGGG